MCVSVGPNSLVRAVEEQELWLLANEGALDAYVFVVGSEGVEYSNWSIEERNGDKMDQQQNKNVWAQFRHSSFKRV